jgi:hypothetical protein
MNATLRPAEYPRRRPRTMIVLATLFLIAVPLTWTGGHALGSSQDESDRTDLRQKRHYGDLINIFTGDIRIPADTIRHGSIICIGGDVVVEGEVSQDVIVILGGVKMDGGEIGGSLFGILSKMELRDAEIHTELYNIAGGMTREEVYVGGQIVDLGILGSWFPGILTLLTWWRVFSLLFVFILLVMLVALAPERVRMIGQEAPVRYVSAFFVGVLAYVALLLLCTVATPTIIGLPVIYLGYLALKWLAIAGMFHALGQRVGRAFGREMSPLGAVLLVYGIYAVILLVLSPLGLPGLALITLIRIFFFCFFEVPAVGLVLLTRVGTKSGRRVPVMEPGPMTPVSPPPPVAPVEQASPPTPRPSASQPGSEPGPIAPADPSEDRSD